MPKNERTRPRAALFEDDQRRPADIDPEELDANDAPSGDSDSDSEVEQEDQSRSHYAEIWKSRLRRSDTLTPQYKGSRVARQDAFEDDSDDPFTRDFDENDETDEEQLNGHVLDTNSSENEGSDQDGGIDVASEEEGDDDGWSGSEGDEVGSLSNNRRDGDVDREELRRIMVEEQKNVSATLSQAAQADATKGRAVKAQRRAFDQLLNVRIRLQKTLVASNSLAAEQNPDINAPDEVVSNAEAAAMNLWNSLNDLRANLQQARSGEKRKHKIYAADTASDTLWSHMQSLEAQERSHRQIILDRWSAKARGASTALASTRGRLNANNAAKPQTLTDVLNSQLLDQDRLVKRTQTPRSCAPVQANAGLAESRSVYDDADFYGLLLKELLEQRSAEASTAALDFSSVQPWQAAREAKTRKVVDTKASKGRKLRYTVHEKLQNFMAPEDRTTWGERQVDELFGSLFGRKVQLGEEADGPGSDGEQEEEEGLMLFRN